MYRHDSAESDIVYFNSGFQNNSNNTEEFDGILNQVNALEAKINYLERKTRSNEEENEILKATIADL